MSRVAILEIALMSDQHLRSAAEPTIRVMMMPRDTNANGTIFGGVILSYLDQAGAAEARKLGQHRVVSVAMDSVQFKQPVYVGDLLSFYTQVLRVGRTSVRIRIHVEAARFRDPAERVPVTTAEMVYVAVDERQRPIPFHNPPPGLNQDRPENAP